ncbi:MAG: Spy/CpxP family protein refolding chaperone [Candidatus Saganbacteria bacterium]|nr:Spy/CpxP family protein refolding chaperone [Candidatus Saganbacteria bacterium]
MKNWSLTAALMIMLLTAGSSHAFPHFGPSAEKFVERIAKDLGLTENQKNTLLSGAKQTELEEKDIHSSDKAIFEKIKEELLKDNPDRKTIHECIEQIGQNETKIQIKRMDRMIDMRKMLTPGQRTKLEAFMKKGRERAEEKFKKMKKNDPKPGDPNGSK